MTKDGDYKTMKPVIGYWRWDEKATTMHRSDGAYVRYLGVDQKSLATGVTLWMLFEVGTSVESIRLPVQQRLAGRDSNFRALWYKADFVGLKIKPDFWFVAERLISDALACWPRGELADAHPTGVGVRGGFINGQFSDSFYRLYLPDYVKTPSASRRIMPISGGKIWTPSSFQPQSTMQMPVGTSVIELSSDSSRVDLLADEHGYIRLRYKDDKFESDRFRCTMPYTGQQWLWSIYESGGTKEDLVRESTKPGEILKNLFKSGRPRQKTSAKSLERFPPIEQERAYAAFHDALLEVPANAVRTERLHAPPTVIQSTAPWRRAGYLAQKCLTATDLKGAELRNSFLDEPDPDALLTSPAGQAFDATNGILTAPNGSTLAVQKIDEMLGLFPTRLMFRCNAYGLDWPVLIRRVDQRPPGDVSWAYSPQLLSRWHIDHGECLEAWKREGHTGLPDPNSWDAMRQFIEEGILSWGDGPAAGPAPQSLATSGGWYDGKWRGTEFQRLLGRPIRSGNISRTDDWYPHAAAARWHRTDTTPIDQADVVNSPYSAAKEPTVPFSKIKHDSSQESLFASGFISRSRREDHTRYNLVDYHGAEGQFRLGGTRSRLESGGLIRLDKNTSATNDHGELAWPPKSMIQQPGLGLWRDLRDAAEGGLRDGETMTVVGGYFFDRFYADSLRITALSARVKDFDYLMFGAGNVFV